MALRYISDDNLILIHNDNYHYSAADIIPPFLQMMDDLCVIADNKDETTWTPEDYNYFKSEFHENLYDFSNSYKYNAEAVKYLIDTLMSRLIILESDDKLLLDLRCLRNIVDYNEANNKYKSQLLILKNYFLINSNGKIINQSVLEDEPDDVKLMEFLFSQPFTLTAKYIHKLITAINLSSDPFILEIRELWIDRINEYQVSTHADVILKFIRVYNEVLNQSAKLFLETKLSSISCLSSKSDTDGKTDNYDDLKDIFDEIDKDETIDLGNDVFDTIYDAINNLPSTNDKEDISDIKDTEDLHNTGIIIDQIDNASNEIKDTSREVDDKLSELEEINDKLISDKDEIDKLVDVINNNKDVDNIDSEVSDLSTSIKENSDRSTQIYAELITDLDKLSGLGSVFDKLTEYIKKINSSYTEDVSNYLDKIYGSLMDAGGNFQDRLNNLLGFTNNYNLLNGSLDNLLLAWNLLNNPSVVIKYLLMGAKAAVETVLLVINTFICTLKAMICFLAGLAKGVIDLIKSILTLSILKQSIDNLINSISTIINDISGTSGDSLTNRILVLSNNSTNKKINELYPSILTICGGDEEKATLFIDLFKSDISSKLTFSSIGSALSSIFKELLKGFLDDLKSSFDNTIKNALGLTDVSDCKMINLKPELDLFKFRLNVPKFKMTLPDIDSKVVKC